MTIFFYNPEGVGDVLLVDLLQDQAQETEVKREADLAVLTEKGTNRVLGYNLFHASSYLSGLSGQKGKWFPTDEDVVVLNEQLTKLGHSPLQIDELPDFIIGRVETKEAHPDADKLNICQVDLGEEQVQIVCGAPNVEAGQKVVVARVGALMPSGTLIKDAELRGIPSSGMICSARELELPNAPQKKGILVLSEEAPVGADFWTYHQES